MTSSFGQLPPHQYVGLAPWVWVEFESADPPHPFPFLGGVDPAVVLSLHDVHQRLSGAIDIAISYVFAGRTSPTDPALRRRLENAYIEVVHSRPQTPHHIQCWREPDGTFHRDYPLDSSQSAVLRYSGLCVCNAVTQQAVPFAFDSHTAPAIGNVVGWLDGMQQASEIRAGVDRLGMAFGAGLAKHVSEFLDLLMIHHCLSATPRASVRSHWLTHHPGSGSHPSRPCGPDVSAPGSLLVLRSMACSMVCRGPGPFPVDFSAPETGCYFLDPRP